jgi:FkbM family methyltransferase
MLRKWLVGSRAGDFMMAARRNTGLLRLALLHPEQFDCAYNDDLALRLTAALCDGDFLDVGAHIGSVSAAVLRRHPKANIIAIEAVPEKAAWLKRRFPGIDVRECAVAAQRGRATFHVDLDQPGYSSLLGTPSEHKSRAIEVELLPLDELLPTQSVSAIKIDVEGAEIEVLRGAPALTARCRPLFVFESALHGDPPAIWQWFTERQYGLYAPCRVPHDGEGMPLDSFLDSHPYPRRTTNYFAIPAEKRAQVRAAARQELGVVT